MIEPVHEVGLSYDLDTSLMERRLPSLLSTLALRASAWGWMPWYRRWKRGEELSAFQLKWLAISLHYLVHGRDNGFDPATVAELRPWRSRSR